MTVTPDIRYKIDIRWSDEDGVFVAVVPELPGCMADGPSYREAVAAAEEAIASWIATARELGRPIPSPKGKLLV